MSRVTHTDVLAYVEIGAIGVAPDGTYVLYGRSDSGHTADWNRRITEVLEGGLANLSTEICDDGTVILGLTDAGAQRLEAAR